MAHALSLSSFRGSSCSLANAISTAELSRRDTMGPYGQLSNFQIRKYTAGGVVYSSMSVHVIWEVECSFAAFSGSNYWFKVSTYTVPELLVLKASCGDT